ncbi:MAG TPA: glycosyltransferase family 39 protein [Thermoleophilaceae bacterium]|jgi:MFS family permease
MSRPRTELLVLGLLTVLGLALRLPLQGQSLFADEISTWWIATTHGLGGAVSTVHSDAEITPPLYFVLSWLATRIDQTPELLRLPSLLAGVAAIPLTYQLGVKTVGRAAGLLAAGFVAVSPFMLFYSSEARGYQVAIALVLGSTLALLAAVDSRRRRWWVVYAVCTCLAAYTHYTTVFPLAAQLIWVLWQHPGARKPALIANAAAVAFFLPWTTGLINDFQSPTTDLLNAIDVLTLHSARVTVERWAVGHPLVIASTRLGAIPGRLALVLLGLGLAAAAAGVAVSWRRGERMRLDSRFALVAGLALGAPAGVLLVSLLGPDLVSVRHLAASWPALALLTAALIVRATAAARVAAVVLIAAFFAIGAVKMQEARFARPDYDAAARTIDRDARSGDIVIDGTNLSPSPPSALDTALHRRHHVVHLGNARVQSDPFRITGPPAPPVPSTRRAIAASPRGRVFIVSNEIFGVSPPRDPLTRAILRAIPRGYRRVSFKSYPGLLRVALLVYEPPASRRG